MSAPSLPSKSERTGVDDRLTPSTLAPFRPAFWFGGFNGLTWMIALGTPMVLLAQHLGASAFQVGLASSFVFLLLPVQILATTTLALFGFKRQMVAAWLVRAIFLLVPLSLASVEPGAAAPWMANALVASLFGFCLCRAVGTAAHLPWMAAIVPLPLRGRFFATDSAVTSVVGVATLLGCAALFEGLPSHAAFLLAYLAALAAAVLAVWNLARLPSAPAPAAPPLPKIAGHALRLCLRRGLFRHYLALMLLGSVVTSSVAAFTAYYLKAVRGLPSSAILLFTAAQFGGQIFGAWTIRHLIDRISLSRFFQAATMLVGVVDLFWLIFLRGASDLVSWLAPAYFVFGMGVGMANVAHFTYLPELAKESDRPLTMAVFTAALGLLSGLAPMLWGLALEDRNPAAPIDVVRFEAFFAVGVALSALLAALYARLPDLRASLAGRETA